MPTHFFPIVTLTQEFEDSSVLSEAIKFHEISRFNTKDEHAILDVRVNVEEILKRVYANDLYRRFSSENYKIKEIELEIEPPTKTLSWRNNINLKFHVVQSIRQDNYLTAYIPALGVAVVSKKKAKFEEKIKQEILSTLQRDGYLKSLQYLRWLERIEKVRLQKEEIAINLPRTKQRAIAEENEDTVEKSVLKESATDLFSVKLKTAYEVRKQIELLAEIFKAKQTSSILLVGKAGVGKTAIFHQLINERNEFDLEDFEFWATSGARLIAGQTGFGMWQERCQKLIDEAKERNAILHLGNLIELLEVGKSMSSMQGIASFLRPKIARGEIISVVECTPEQIPVIERNDANLLGAFQQIRIEEPDRKRSLIILESVTKELSQNKTIEKNESEAIRTIDSIHRRYSTYSAFPGRPVNFLRNVFADIGKDEKFSSNRVIKAFSNETGLPEMLLSNEIPLDLSETEKFFKQKVIGQDEAVKLITNLIATVKTKLTRPRKPIASLLFIGPTGVGKTEMVKSLTEFFFTEKERMIRFDMSEFSNQLSVQRLIGGTGEKEGLLTAKVREQPFSVILLDEFEKAHNSFFDLLLQILGEGRLTDSVGRVADFTNSIIVMTSNLGASEFQRGKSGFLRNSRERKNAVKHFDSAVRDFLRPEIFNRLDRIVPFSPLDEKTVLNIAELEIKKLKMRDGLRFRPVELEITNDALKHLATKGYDIRYGARPLKRTLERELLVPIATELNLRPIDKKLLVKCGLLNDKLNIEFIGENKTKTQHLATKVLASNAEKIAGLRRKMQKFLASYRLTELKDEIYRIIKLEALEKRGRWISQEDYRRIEKKLKLQNFLDKLNKFSDEINQTENKILLEIYGKSSQNDSNYPIQITEIEKRLRKYLFELLKFQYHNPNEIKLVLFSQNSATLFRIARYYATSMRENKNKISNILYFSTQSQAKQKAETILLFGREVWRKETNETENFLAKTPNETFGFILHIEGDLVLPRFGAEIGIHRFTNGAKNDRVLVSVTSGEFNKYTLPIDLEKHDSIKSQDERRVYDLPNNKVKDLLLEKTFSLEQNVLQNLFIEMIEMQLQKTADNLIE